MRKELVNQKVCHRCCTPLRAEDFSHECRPTEGWRRLEASRDSLAELSNRYGEERAELLAALESMVQVARLTIGWSATPPNADGPLVVAERLIARIKGRAS